MTAMGMTTDEIVLLQEVAERQLLNSAFIISEVISSTAPNTTHHFEPIEASRHNEPRGARIQESLYTPSEHLNVNGIRRGHRAGRDRGVHR